MGLKNIQENDSTETFGLPDCDTHLIAKLRVLRAMDPDLYASITTPTATK